MNGAIYASPAIRQTAHSCIDVKSDGKVVVIGEVGDRNTQSMHFTTARAFNTFRRYCDEAAKCLAARGAK